MRRATALFERPGGGERPALQPGDGTVRRGRWLRFDLRTERLRRIPRDKSQLRCKPVVPPCDRVVRHPVDHGMTYIRRNETATQEFEQVVVAEPASHHPAIFRLGKRGSDAD